MSISQVTVWARSFQSRGMEDGTCQCPRPAGKGAARELGVPKGGGEVVRERRCSRAGHRSSLLLLSNTIPCCLFGAHAHGARNPTGCGSSVGFLPTGCEWKPFLLLLLLLGSVLTGWAGLALVPAFWQHQEQALGSPPGSRGQGEVPHPDPREGPRQRSGSVVLNRGPWHHLETCRNANCGARLQTY